MLPKPPTTSGCPATVLADQGLSLMQISLRLGWPHGLLYRVLLRNKRLHEPLPTDQHPLALQLYARDRLSIDQVTAFLTCTRQAVKDVLTAHHVPMVNHRPSRRTLPEDRRKALVAELKLGELTCRQLMAKYEVCAGVMLYAAKEEGYVFGQGQAHYSRRRRLKRQDQAEEVHARALAARKRMNDAQWAEHKREQAEGRLQARVEQYAIWRAWWAEGRSTAWMAEQLQIPVMRLCQKTYWLRKKYGWFPARHPDRR